MTLCLAIKLQKFSTICWARLQASLSRSGLLGSMSFLQTRHLSAPAIAFNPPQLPLIFLPMSITPKDMPSTIRSSNTNANTNVSKLMAPLGLLKALWLFNFSGPKFKERTGPCGK